MLYLDSSALIKRFLEETGTDELNVKLLQATHAGELILTSFLSYAEIHSALARKLYEWEGRSISARRAKVSPRPRSSGSLRATEYHRVANQFESEWRSYHLVEVSQLVLDFIPDLVKRHPLKASDAIQLASAVWASRATWPTETRKPAQSPIVFATSDKKLAAAAEYEQFEVFNPEKP